MELANFQISGKETISKNQSVIPSLVFTILGRETEIEIQGLYMSLSWIINKSDNL